jgi:hypothetical protein
VNGFRQKLSRPFLSEGSQQYFYKIFVGKQIALPLLLCPALFCLLVTIGYLVMAGSLVVS